MEGSTSYLTGRLYKHNASAARARARARPPARSRPPPPSPPPPPSFLPHCEKNATGSYRRPNTLGKCGERRSPPAPRRRLALARLGIERAKRKENECKCEIEYCMIIAQTKWQRTRFIWCQPRSSSSAPWPSLPTSTSPLSISPSFLCQISNRGKTNGMRKQFLPEAELAFARRRRQLQQDDTLQYKLSPGGRGNIFPHNLTRKDWRGRRPFPTKY